MLCSHMIHGHYNIDTGDAQQCMSTDDERSLRLQANFEGDGFMVAVQECNADLSTWTNTCGRQSTTLNITRICELRGKITIVHYG